MAIVYATVGGGVVTHECKEIRTYRLQAAINRLAPGDELHILPGRYTDTFVVSQGGHRDAPIRIKASKAGTVVFDGRQDKHSASDDFKPMDDDFAFVKIMGADWVELSDVCFENCWPCAIFVRGVKHITVSDCNIRGGRFGLYARNWWSRKKSRHLTLRNVTWVQDVDHDMWEGRVTWMDVKQTESTPTDARYFNGALFGSYEVKGPVTIEGCDVSHAFNAIRIDAKSSSPTRNRNKDIRVSGSRFSYIRDNAIEPEKVAENMYVLDNSFFNVHAAFSLDGVTGKNWYFIGNRILNLRKPGLRAQPNRGGKIFKFHSDAPYPTGSFYCLFNSIQTRTAYVKSGQTRELLHAANAIGICRDGPDCDTDRLFFGSKFKWHDSLTFSDDLCDHPDFPDALNDAGYKVSGTQAATGLFDSPLNLAINKVAGVHWNGQLPLKPEHVGHKTLKDIVVQTPDGRNIRLPAGQAIGSPAPAELLTIGVVKTAGV